MNPHARTPQKAGDDKPARKPEPTDSTVSDNTTDDAGSRRQAAAHVRSSADHQSRADAARGDADTARGRAAEADNRGDSATAGAEWSDAAGLDGLAAHEATTAAIDARAAAAAAQSTTTQAGPTGRRRPGPSRPVAAAGQGRAPTPQPGAARRNIS